MPSRARSSVEFVIRVVDRSECFVVSCGFLGRGFEVGGGAAMACPGTSATGRLDSKGIGQSKHGVEPWAPGKEAKDDTSPGVQDLGGDQDDLLQERSKFHSK